MILCKIFVWRYDRGGSVMITLKKTFIVFLFLTLGNTNPVFSDDKSESKKTQFQFLYKVGKVGLLSILRQF
ncbi:hypothetical protein LEP1GSC170_3162 [Leptospira interrogans serovar Bataviae str. HAI135]|nr:hypothetical protein LEP1GSC170_3162 [Leptospira interrogans serovar Bataviae str. HAI135]